MHSFYFGHCLHNRFWIWWCYWQKARWPNSQNYEKKLIGIKKKNLTLLYFINQVPLQQTKKGEKELIRFRTLPPITFPKFSLESNIICNKHHWSMPWKLFCMLPWLTLSRVCFNYHWRMLDKGIKVYWYDLFFSLILAQVICLVPPSTLSLPNIKAM